MGEIIAGVDLYWIPLGAGAHVVRLSGKVFEATSALMQRRVRCDLYHSALVVHVGGTRFIVEQTPVPRDSSDDRGVVASGSVGVRGLGRLRVFRYEIRCWREGAIPDIAEAVSSPVRLTDDPGLTQRVLDSLPTVPTPVWGRDELRGGEMWNSNSVVSWVLTTSGIDISRATLPRCGRAPGWGAGVVVAQRPRGRPFGDSTTDVVGKSANVGAKSVRRRCR